MNFEPLDPSFQNDPYSAYAWLRDNEPVHQHPAGPGYPEYFALSRFEDIWNAVRDPETFSSAQGLTFFPDEIAKLGLPPNIVMLDPPRHTRLRSLIGRGFTPRHVARLEARIRAFCRERLAGLGPDLHQGYSATIPTFVLAELFGVPEADRVRFGPWVQQVTALQDQTLSGSDASSSSFTAVAELLGYFSDVLADRRAGIGRGEDLITSLVDAEIDGERLTDWDILGFCFVVTAGGSETTAGLISHAVSLLSTAPSQRAELAADPSLMEAAVSEFLRLESPVQGLARTTTRDVTLHQVTIPTGTKVLMLYGSANRDPREFGPTADSLNIHREIPRHLAFSSGPHFCIGNHLARLQARVALEELLAAYPNIEVDAANGVRHQSAFVRTWVELPVARRR